MPVSFLPGIVTDALTDITPELLRSRKIRLLMLDFDNTIVPYTTNIPDEEMDRWLRNMLRSEIGLCVVSNSRNNRVPDFCREYGIPCVVRAKKPGTKGIRQALAQFEICPKEAALAGDQIFTDVLGGNSAGDNVLHLGANESGTLAGLNVLEFHNLHNLAFHVEGNAVSKFTCRNHNKYPPKLCPITELNVYIPKLIYSNRNFRIFQGEN